MRTLETTTRPFHVVLRGRPHGGVYRGSAPRRRGPPPASGHLVRRRCFQAEMLVIL